MRLNPYSILVSLIILLILTSAIFFFATPDSLKNDSNHSTKTKNKIGFWGEVTAEIDWCEYNHVDSFYVAEPHNSISSLWYCFLAIAAYGLHYPVLQKDASYRSIILFHNLNLIGIGSTLFHGTLQYGYQLFDEIPMIYFILNAAWIINQRKTVHCTQQGWILGFFLTLLSVLLTSIMIFTERSDSIHMQFRGLFVIIFAISLVYVFYKSSISIVEIEALGFKKQALEMSDVFSLAFFSIVIALLSWICDNMLCAQLQTLPVYINFHAFGWHIFTGLAVYFLTVAITLQRTCILGLNCEIKFIFGVVPFVKEVEGKRGDMAKNKESAASKKIK